MKKFSILVLALVLAISMVACNSSGNTADNNPQETTNVSSDSSPASAAPTTNTETEKDSLAGTTWVFETSYKSSGEENSAEYITGAGLDQNSFKFGLNGDVQKMFKPSAESGLMGTYTFLSDTELELNMDNGFRIFTGILEDDKLTIIEKHGDRDVYRKK